MVHTGSCHCGRIRLHVEGEVDGALACNCSICQRGIHPHGEGVDPKGRQLAAINTRCLEGIDISAVPVQHHDGRST